MIVLENTSIESLGELTEQEVLGLIVSRQGLGDLGTSFFQRLKEAFQPTMQLHRRIVKKLPKPLQRVMSTKFFLKAAPFLSIAAEVLNLVVPGLGVLVSLAINAAATAISLAEAKKAKDKFRKASAAEDAKDAADIKKANAEANASLDKAYQGGQTYFIAAYQMTPDSWKKLTVDKKTKFLNLVMFDQHKDVMDSLGVDRTAFQALTVAQQQDVLAKAVSTLPSAPGPYVSPPPETPAQIAQGGGTIAPFMGISNPMIYVAGGLGLVALGLVLWKVSRKV